MRNLLSYRAVDPLALPLCAISLNLLPPMRRSLPPLRLALLVLVLSCTPDETQNASVATQAPSLTPKPSTSAVASVATEPSASRPPSQPHPPAATRPLMIGYTRDYCLPCQVMKPWIAQLRRAYTQQVDVAVVNLDRKKNQRFAPFLGARSVPTQIFVGPSGRIEARHEGVSTAEEMTATFRRLGWIQ